MLIYYRIFMTCLVNLKPRPKKNAGPGELSKYGVTDRIFDILTTQLGKQ